LRHQAKENYRHAAKYFKKINHSHGVSRANRGL
jgi:hypothetical protein